MAKFVSDPVLDASCAKVATCTRQVITSAQPANFAGISAVALADRTLVAGDGNGDWVIGNGDTSGRKARVDAQSAVTIDSSGTATHVCHDDATTLQWVTTCTSQALVGGGTVDIPALDVEFADVTP